MEKLQTIKTTKLASDDNWSYIVTVYEDITDIFIQEEDKKPELIGQLTAGYDLQVCEEIIKLRNEKIAEG